jgi:hypothetical protein
VVAYFDAHDLRIEYLDEDPADGTVASAKLVNEVFLMDCDLMRVEDGLDLNDRALVDVLDNK